MSFAVEPEQLAQAAALTARDAAGLSEAARLVVAAGGQAAGGIAPGSEVLRGSLGGWLQVETTVAAALGEAAQVLTSGLTQAGERYAAAESASVAGFSGWSGGGRR